MSKPVLAYWDLRGLGEPCRLMMECVGLEYEDKRLHQEDPEEWEQLKIELGMDFPNLPYLHIGDFKLSESMAILRHFGRKYDMMPANADLGDMMEGVVNDFRWSFYKLCYADFEAEKEAYFEGIKVKMDRFETHLSKNAWIADDKLTYVDFVMCEMLSQMMIAKPDLLKSHTKMAEYLSKFERL